MIIAVAAEIQNNFEKFLSAAVSSHSITDSLAGIVEGNYDLDAEKMEELKAKYGISDEQKE